MKLNGTGCVFESFGRIPKDVYTTSDNVLHTPIEQAVIDNNCEALKKAIEVTLRTCFVTALLKTFVTALS